MPDDVVFAKMRLVRTKLTDAQTTQGEREQVFKLAEVDCFPPPGSTATYVQPDTIGPLVYGANLQSEEKVRISLLCQRHDPTLNNIDECISAVLGQFGFTKLGINYVNDIYQKMFTVLECFTVRIYLRVKYEVYEVKITANEQLTVGGTTFPQGDELATFRVGQPVQWRFEARPKWNPECCPTMPARVVEDTITPWYPRERAPGVHYDWNKWKYYGLPKGWGLGGDW